MPGRRCMRGRPRRRRWVEDYFDRTYFKPAGVPLGDIVVNLLDNEQVEAIRLVDLEGLSQEAAAKKMGVSRPTFWRELNEARKKIADSLVNGKAIQIGGGDYKIRESGEDKEDNTKTGE